MHSTITLADLIQLNEALYELPESFNDQMRVPARVFTNSEMLLDILEDKSWWQLSNVATLPGIVGAAYAMPDIHQGYGFPIGGVAATEINNGGIISPGGIGYDINCGVRLLTASLSAQALKPYLESLADALYDLVPSGVGKGGDFLLIPSQMQEILQGGAARMLELGYGTPADLVFCEEQGAMSGACPDLISTTAKERGKDQLGTLGSGNHFLEVQKIDRIFDPIAAAAFGLVEGNVTIMIHCGSRGLGHQVCTDYVRSFMPHLKTWDIELPDRELVCAPFLSEQGQNYFAAMQASANFAWANRHMIAHNARKAWRNTVSKEVDLRLVYDVSHNMGKREMHLVEGRQAELLVHRKGATRAFGPSRLETPAQYKSVGQPVLIPGTMGTASYVLVGTDKSAEVAFSSSCHGAGRKMSRMKAKKEVHGARLRHSLEKNGILIRCDSSYGLAEEAPQAYKDIESVIEVVKKSNLAQPVARLTPLAVIKGG